MNLSRRRFCQMLSGLPLLGAVLGCVPKPKARWQGPTEGRLVFPGRITDMFYVGADLIVFTESQTYLVRPDDTVEVVPERLLNGHKSRAASQWLAEAVPAEFGRYTINVKAEGDRWIQDEVS